MSICRNSRVKELEVWDKKDLKFESSAYLPSILIDSWEDLRDLLKTEHFNNVGFDWIFRGQSNSEWKLQSTLERLESSSLELRGKHLNLFKKECRRALKDFNELLNDTSEENENEFWAIGQHYGLSTPLLDWSYSPYVALFFAFKDEWVQTCEEKYHAIFALNMTRLKNDFYSKWEDEDKENMLNGLFFEPKVDKFGRLVSQSGLFTIAPYCSSFEDTIIDVLRSKNIISPQDISQYICKIYIKTSVKDRRDCLDHLQQMNIHYGTLFPDIEGAAKYCNQVIKKMYGMDC